MRVDQGSPRTHFPQVDHSNSEQDQCFLLIDGWDKYTGNHGDIMALLRDLSTAEDAKIGVSTRPYIAFQTGFHSYPSLML